MRVINPDELFDPTERLYSHARLEDGILYMSGQVGWDADRNLAGPGIESQARQAFDNVGVILDTVDEEFSSVAKVTSYFTDIETDLGPYKEVWGEVFSEPYPAHTAIGVDALATEELRLELEVEVPIEE